MTTNTYDYKAITTDFINPSTYGSNVNISDLNVSSSVILGGNTITGSTSGLDTTSVFLDKKLGTYAYLTAPASTTCTVAGTWYPISGTFANPVSEGFTVSPLFITYVGTRTLYFEVDWHASASCNLNLCTIGIGIAKNGTVDVGSIMSTQLLLTPNLYALSGTVVLQLAPNDTLSLNVRAARSGDVITINSFTTTAARFF